ncbi:MAG: hypothetical protein ACUVQ8_00255 [Nitrososphaeria archaeon]
MAAKDDIRYTIIPFLVMVVLYVVSFAAVSYNIRIDDLKSLLVDPYYQKVFYNTFLQAVLSMASTILLAIPISYFLARYDFPAKNLLKFVFLTPFFIPAFAAAEAFILIFRERHTREASGTDIWQHTANNSYSIHNEHRHPRPHLLLSSVRRCTTTRWH